MSHRLMLVRFLLVVWWAGVMLLSNVGIASVEDSSADKIVKVVPEKKHLEGKAAMKLAKKNQNKKAMPGQLGTSFRFGADSLHGKYLNSASTTATVENDKYLNDLLSPPKNFNGRAQQEKERN